MLVLHQVGASARHIAAQRRVQVHVRHAPLRLAYKNVPHISDTTHIAHTQKTTMDNHSMIIAQPSHHSIRVIGRDLPGPAIGEEAAVEGVTKRRWPRQEILNFKGQTGQILRS